MPRSKSRKTKNPLLLEARILGAFNDQPMLHLDDIAAIAIQCDPMPTLKKVKTLLDKLVEEGWLRALPDLWFSRVTSSINSSSLTFDHNDYEKKALQSLKKCHFRESDNLATVAHFVVLVALQHPRQISGWIQAMVHYTRAEGLNQREFLWKDIAAKSEIRDEWKGGAI